MPLDVPQTFLQVDLGMLIWHLTTFCSGFCPTRGKAMPSPVLEMHSFMLVKTAATQ